MTLERWIMPVLMLALLALAVFGVIGILLLAAVILEQRKLKGKDGQLSPRPEN